MESTTLIIMKDIITIITPFAIAYLAYISTKKEKKEEKYRLLQKKAEQERDMLLLEKEEKKEEVFDKLIKDIAIMKTDFSKDINNLNKRVEEIAKANNIEALNNQLSKLALISTVNFEYSQSMSTVVVTIGEALQKSTYDENNDISHAISKHKEDEKTLIGKMYKMIC